MNRVRSFTGGRSEWSLVAGAESKCDCHPQHCPCGSDALQLATEAHLHLPVALAVTPDARVHVADLGNLRLKTVGPPPLSAPASGLVQIPSPATQELYLFNRFGQHLATRNLLTGSSLSPHAPIMAHGEMFRRVHVQLHVPHGRLLRAAGERGGRGWAEDVLHPGVPLRRPHRDRTRPQVHRSRAPHPSYSPHFSSREVRCVQVSVKGMLEKLEAADGSSVRLEYEANTGLLASFVDAEDVAAVFEYDYYGHLVRLPLPLVPAWPKGRVVLQQRVVRSDGSVWDVSAELGGEGLKVEVSEDGRPWRSFLATPTSLTLTQGTHSLSICVVP